MKLPLFAERPTIDAETFAEAQALLDEGLDRDTVLDLFGADAAWLAPLLATTGAVRKAYAAEEPSFYFEASLKAKLLAAASGPAPVAAAPSTSLHRLRAAVAGMAVVTAAAGAAVFTLGFITAGQSVPGDWNYAFKLANERLQYSLSTGDGRVNVQLSHTEARVYEIQQLSSSGDLAPSDLEKLSREARDLADLARQQQFDEVQKARLRALTETTNAVLNDVKVKKGFEPAAQSASSAVNDAYSAGVGAATVLPTPPATSTPEPSPTATPVTPTPSPTATATTTTTATPTATATSQATATPSPTPSPTPIPSPSPSPSPTPSATPTP